MFGLILAASVMAKPIDMDTWIAPQDYPKEALRTGTRGYVLYTVLVSPAGRVVSCRTEGKSSLDRAFCARISADARFQPALDDDGKPVFSIYKNQIKAAISATTMPPSPKRYDRVLTVDRLPDRAINPSYSRVHVTVGPDGKMMQCTPQRWELAQPEDIAQFLGRVVCGELSGDHRFNIEKDENGQPVSYIRSMMVRFDAPVAGE